MEALNLTGNYNIKNRPVRFECAGTEILSLERRSF